MVKAAIALILVVALAICLVLWIVHRIDERRQLGPEITGLGWRGRRAALRELRKDRELQRDLQRQNELADQFNLNPRRNAL